MSTNVRRPLAVGFTVITAVLLFSSAAFACTTYKGRFAVQGNGKTTRTATGSNSGMSYCNGTVPAKADIPALASPAFYAAVGPTSGSGSCDSKLPTGYTYYIDYQPGVAYYGDCMHQSAGNQTLGTMTVDSNGYSGTYSYPQAGYSFKPQLGEGDVCVSDYWYNWGNQMPVWVL